MTPTLTLTLTQQLIARPSITPQDAGCLDLITARLAPLGFVCERLDSGPADARVSNLWAKRTAHNAGAASSAHAPAHTNAQTSAGANPNTPAHTPANQHSHPSSAPKLLVFAGHTDVVPTGPLNQWQSHPFTPTLREGKLFGRGAADMKTSIAAFVVACEEFLAAKPDAPLSIALLLTSDEEGPAVDGTVKVCEALQARGERLDYCIVGEPTSVQSLGDTVKNGRRGSLSGQLTIHGVQGHIAYPQLAQNPIHLFAPALAELVATEWDAGNAAFPPTSWQVSNIHAGTGAGNVIPGSLVVDFNFRYSTESSPERLQQRFSAVLGKHHLRYRLDWTLGGLPFLTEPGSLVQAVVGAIADETGTQAKLSTTGGTSDGRFIAQICPQVIELGPCNASIHKIDECVSVAEVEPLKNIYRRVLEKLAG